MEKIFLQWLSISPPLLLSSSHLHNHEWMVTEVGKWGYGQKDNWDCQCHWMQMMWLFERDLMVSIPSLVLSLKYSAQQILQHDGFCGVMWEISISHLKGSWILWILRSDRCMELIACQTSQGFGFYSLVDWNWDGFFSGWQRLICACEDSVAQRDWD